MSKIINTITLHDGHVEVVVERTGIQAYKCSVLLDIEDLQKVGKMRVSNGNYAYCCGARGENVAHLVMGHVSNMETVVDHINGNSLDNRKSNLRVLPQNLNANNRTTSRNNTGVVGIAYRENGGYKFYRATVFDIRVPVISGKTKSATKRYSKHFNINKLGREEAFTQAKEWLRAKRVEFGYLEQSGSEIIERQHKLNRVE